MTYYLYIIFVNWRGDFVGKIAAIRTHCEIQCKINKKWKHAKRWQKFEKKFKKVKKWQQGPTSGNYSVLVLLSRHVTRFSVSSMQDILPWSFPEFQAPFNQFTKWLWNWPDKNKHVCQQTQQNFSSIKVHKGYIQFFFLTLVAVLKEVVKVLTKVKLVAVGT